MCKKNLAIDYNYMEYKFHELNYILKTVFDTIFQLIKIHKIAGGKALSLSLVSIIHNFNFIAYSIRQCYTRSLTT